MSHTIYIAYGSESGNAKALAMTLFGKTSPTYSVNLLELNELVLSDLSEQDTLLILTSSFGDGEPPGNASEFYERLMEADAVNCQFAVFGLGDVSYPKFCGFSIAIDEQLNKLGATAIANRVDADTNYQPFFTQWADALLAHFAGQSDRLQQLTLQTKAYSEDQSYTAKVTANTCINTGDFPVYDISIDITGSGMHYQAGDLLYLLPPANAGTLARIQDFYGEISTADIAALGKKELRLLGKPLLRAVAKHTKNADLKKLTKISAAAQLAEYIYGRDVADVLQDFCTPQNLSITDLLAILSTQLPRAYSIASCGSVSPHDVRLCVREVNYQQNGTHYVGSGSHFLATTQVGDDVAVFVRANPHFHLPENDSVPIIMIGAGTGIAPYLGFLATPRSGAAHLFFGERHAEHDFLYQEILQQHLKNGNLTALHTAFSRDQTEKIYVQNRLQEQGQQVWALLQNKAEIYLCGSKENLGKSIDHVLCGIAQAQGGLNEEQAKQWLYDLVSTQRYHQDLY